MAAAAGGVKVTTAVPLVTLTPLIIGNTLVMAGPADGGKYTYLTGLAIATDGTDAPAKLVAVTWIL